MRRTPLLLCLVSLIIPLTASAALKDLRSEELEGFGSLQFQMIGPENAPEIIGDWTLIRPGNERTEGDDANFYFEELPAGMYTFSIDQPQGTSIAIEVLLNGKLIDTITTPQVSFPIDGQDRFLLKVKHEFTRTVTVAVNSKPSGLSFTLKAPNDAEFRGTTPESFHNVPEGQYSAYFDEIEGCPIVPPQSDRLVKDSRITLSINIVCENMPEDIAPDPEKELEHVSVSIDGRTVIFKDVKTQSWFAPYVYKVIRAAIISGYQDRSGNPKGEFGPGNNVTVAQLAKVAHEMSGIDETKVRVRVTNTRTKGQWFEKYFASAEQRWWEVWRDKRVDPSRPATRAEVIATVLRALNVRTVWAEGKTFGDVFPTHQYAHAIETAAADGLIDAGGTFRPDDPINRAEMAKIVANAIELYIEDTLEVKGGSW